MKLNKKYFFVTSAVIVLNCISAVSNAENYCESQIIKYCSLYDPDRSKNCLDHEIKDTKRSIEWVHGSCENGTNIEATNRLAHGKRELNKSRQSHEYRDKYLKIAQFELDVCEYETALALCSNSNGNSQQNSQSPLNSTSPSASSDSSNQTTNSNSAKSSQQNSTPEDVERNNVRSYSAQQTAAYQQKYKGRGKKHNLDAVANRCIKTKGKKVLNTCDFDIEVVFCAKNPDPNSKHAFEMANGFDCARNSKGMWGISANDALMGVFTADSVSVFACKKPSLPGAEIDPQTLSLVGRCGEY